MRDIKISVPKWITGAICFAMIFLLGAAPAWPQTEKHTVFTEYDFHWQGRLKAGQTLEVINRNGQIEASAPAGDEVRVEGLRRGNDDDHELFIEVVEYSDGVTICAVHANDKTPGRCHRGGVSSESTRWHGNRAKINFEVQVPRGVRFNALTTNGGIRVSMGSAKWNGELHLKTTNGSVDVTLPASAEFKLDATTTNGEIQADFPITVQGSVHSKELSGTVGGGGRELRLATTNGTIKLMKS